MIAIDTFTSLTRTLVRQVYPMIRQAVAADARPPVTKVDGSFVTETDRWVEELFTREFEKAFPATPVIGEEAAADAHEKGINDPQQYYGALMSATHHIIMDPIDGTKNFVEGRPEFCIAVALTKRVGNGVWPECGLVAIPVAGVMYWCDQVAVFREEIESGKVTRVERRSVPEARVSVSSKDRSWLRENHLRIVCPWVSSGSSVHDFLGTALGDLRGSMVRSQRLWDLMAPLAIAERLGCELVDLLTRERVTSVSPNDLSDDIVQRPWGLTRRLMLLPRGRAIAEVITSEGD